MTVTVCPATTTDPARFGPEFARTFNCTCRGPVPLEGATVIHDVDELVVQAQFAVVFTDTVKAVALDATLSNCTGATS